MLNEFNKESFPTSGEIQMDDFPFESSTPRRTQNDNSSFESNEPRIPQNDSRSFESNEPRMPQNDSRSFESSEPRRAQNDNYSFNQTVNSPRESQPNNYAYQAAASEPVKKRATIKELKKHARSDMKWGRLTGAMIVAILIIGVFQGIFNGVSSVMSNQTIALAISGVGSLLTMFLSAAVTAGLLTIFLETKRGRNDTGVLGRFDRMLPMLGVILLVSLLVIWPLLVAGIVLGVGFVLQNQIVLYVGLGLMLVAYILAIIFSLKYSQATVLCADGHGVISSLKTSKRIMKGRKLQLFGLQLSFLGWIFLGILFGALLNVLIGTIPFYFMPEVSTVGVIGANLNTLVAIYIALFPTLIYMAMTQIEFYEDTMGNGLNPFKEKTTKKPIWIVALLTLLVALVSAGMFMLPIAKVSADDARVSLGGVNFEARKGYLGFTTDGTQQTPTVNVPIIDNPDGPIDIGTTPEEPVTEDPTVETPAQDPINTGSTPLIGIKYTIPEGYEVLDESDSSAYYIKGADSISIYKSEAYNGLTYLEDYYDAEKVTVNGIDCYYYYTGETFKEHSYCFEHNGYEYDIRSTVDSDARSVVESITLN